MRVKTFFTVNVLSPETYYQLLLSEVNWQKFFFTFFTFLGNSTVLAYFIVTLATNADILNVPS